MAVKGAWMFLQQQGITGTTVERPVDALGWREAQKKIHVDVVDAFFKLLKKCFLNCEMGDQQAMTDASNKLLRLIGAIVPKNRSILYLDGNPSLERDLVHRNRLTAHLKRQQALEQELLEYEARPNDALLARITSRARNSFRFTRDMQQALYQTAQQKGWAIIVAPGEAEVEIGKVGGIVLTEDSDMLFYPNISAVIRQTGEHQFNVYHKSSILAKLQISSNAFTAIGIVAPNDYESKTYETSKTFSVHPRNICAFFKGKQSDKDLSINDYIQEYIRKLNTVPGRDVSNDYYAKSYRVFALQEEYILPPSYDIRSGFLHNSAYYLKKIRDLQSHSQQSIYENSK